MINIIKEAGCLLTYTLHKIKKNSKINPIYAKIDFNNNVTIKELTGDSLSDTIPQGLNLLEK